MLRIGELSKRSGVSPELLRAWERRYGLLEPTRSAGGLRLYSLDDLERVRLMQGHLAGGLAAAEAAALASSPEHRDAASEGRACRPRPPCATWPRRSTPSTSRARRRCSTSCSPWPPSTRC